MVMAFDNEVGLSAVELVIEPDLENGSTSSPDKNFIPLGVRILVVADPDGLHLELHLPTLLLLKFDLAHLPLG